MIRDKLTYKGKGIGYVKFVSKEDQQKCLDLQDKLNFKNRQLRIQKAKKNKLKNKHEN